MSHDLGEIAEEAAMPSPRRTVRRGVKVCMRMGMSESEALATILAVCDQVMIRTYGRQGYTIRWLAAVYHETQARQARMGRR